MRTRLGILIGLVLLATPLSAQTVRVWDAPLPDEMLAADPADVVDLLGQYDYDASTIPTGRLLDDDVLTPRKVPLLVVPSIGSYPREGMDVLLDYLTSGGRVLCLGGVPFSRALIRGDDGWEQVVVPDQPPGEVNVIADFDEVTPEVTTRGGEGDPIGWETVATDGGRALRASVDDLQKWQYVEIPVSETGDESFSVLHFRARGDANTPVLGLELTETDDSRWKYVIPLSENWREYTIFIPHFLSYATEDRGGEGDYLHPERLKMLSFGITNGMVGEGPHTIWLDDIERWQFEAPDRKVVPRDRTVLSDTIDAYGNLVVVPPDQQHPLMRLFEDATGFESEEIVPQYVSRRLRLHDGWTVSPSTDSGPAYDEVVMSPRRTARVVPLLELQSEGGTIAGVYQAYRGDLANATIGFLALKGDELLRDPFVREAAVRAATYMTRAPRLLDVEPEFALENGAPAMMLTAHLAGPVTECEAQVQFEIGPIAGAPQWQSTEAVALPADGHETLQLSVPAREFSHRSFALTASAGLEGGGEPDRLRIEVDVLQALTDLCDFFVEQQGEDGVISWAGYIDQRAVRALLVMYDLTGEQKYLDAATRWGDHEVEQQREDGGYRMGYGITDTSEVCYVADGGEIAIGMVRLLSYVSEERRERYMQSLREYYRYRENFRLEDGTIGVGWVFHDRFTQKGGEGVHEEAIRSDKSFGFVTSCTLAGVSAWQAILDDPEVREMVIHDARWYLEDVSKATSVSGEAAQWAHYFIEDADLRADLEQRMRETLVPFALEGSGWWYASGGRSAVTLGALAYYHSQIEASPEAMVGILRGVYRMTSRHSPASVYKVMAHDDLDSNEWRYLAYSAVSLAEVLDPLSTMEGIAQ